MKLFPRILFLITSIICGFYLAKNFYEGPEYNGTFWIAILWFFMGLYLYKYPMGSGKIDKK